MDHKKYIFPKGYRSIVDVTREELEKSNSLLSNPHFIRSIQFRNRLVELGLSLVTANKIVAYSINDFPSPEELEPYSDEEKAEILENSCQSIVNVFNHMKNEFDYEFAMIAFERANG